MSTRVKIGLIYSPPLSTNCSLEQSCQMPGLGVEVTRIACHHMRWNCTYHWFGSGEYGDVPNENSTVASGLVGAIQRGEFDTAFAVFTPTYRRSKAIDFADSVFYSDIVMVTRSTESHADDETRWNIVKAWQWPIWCCFLIAIALTATILILTSWKPHMGARSKKRHWPVHFFETVTALMNIEHGMNKLKHSPIRVVFGFWTVAAVILSSAYTGVLFSRRIISDSNPPFVDLPTFATCLEKRQCRLTGATLSISFLQVLTSKESLLGARISNSFDYNPPLVVSSQDEVPRTILEVKNQYLVAFVDTASALDFAQKFEQCRFRIVNTGYSEVWTFPIRKKSPLKKYLNRIAMSFQEQGLAKAVLLKYSSSAKTQCDDGGSDFNAVVQGISFEEINLIFYFFVGGLCASIVCAFGEMAYKKISRKVTRVEDEEPVYRGVRVLHS